MYKASVQPVLDRAQVQNMHSTHEVGAAFVTQSIGKAKELEGSQHDLIIRSYLLSTNNIDTLD